MKTIKLTIMSLAIFGALYSCTPENLENNEYQTDKKEVCPPNDRNCNGIPDNEE